MDVFYWVSCEIKLLMALYKTLYKRNLNVCFECCPELWKKSEEPLDCQLNPAAFKIRTSSQMKLAKLRGSELPPKFTMHFILNQIKVNK